jgi:alcohol dehydrogenase class IV
VSGDFVWEDAGRTVVFAGDGVERAAALLAEHGFDSYRLLSTPRALAGAERLAAAATSVHEVSPGQVPEIAAALLDRVGTGPLVALGGGRVIDAAKALASVTGAAVAAIPTTMSGAEMTAIHRLPAGAEDRVAQTIRPDLVIADPAAMTSQPEAKLRASSMNALAHGADSLYTPLASPVSELVALRGAELIAASLDQSPGERDRSGLALGSILCGYAIDSARFGLHHLVCQTLVRICGAPHAETNAAILPRAAAFLAGRAPDVFGPFAKAIGTDLDGLEPRLLELGGNPAALGTLAADPTKLDEAIEAMLQRPELQYVPRPPSHTELAELLSPAW